MHSPSPFAEQDAPARRWAASGAMALTGRAEGPPLAAPAPVVARLVELGERAGADALALLAERAAVAGLSRRGDRSCGGASRLLPASDGWVAVTLARDEDVDLVPAWLETATGADDPWAAVAAGLIDRPGAALVQRGRMLGLPVAMVASVLAPRRGANEARVPGLASLPVLATPYPGAPRRHLGRSSPLVVDLSSLWAGPLCARLLGKAGCDVVKVESTHRPDGARRGPAEFFDLLHGGHRAVALDLRTPEGVADLGRLLAFADVVIEASRPRALSQRGLAPEDLLAAGGGPSVWISITGYGRTGPARDWVAFGDDAAAAGGLVAWDEAGPCFVADAVADPLSGLAAAAAVHAVLAAGGRWLVDVAMASVAAHVAGAGLGPAGSEPAGAGAPTTRWTPQGAPQQAVVAVQPTRPPPVLRRAPGFGEHTDEVLSQLDGAGEAEK